MSYTSRPVPEVTDGRQARGRCLFSATVELFEQYGLWRKRQVGKYAWIVSRTIDPASAESNSLHTGRSEDHE